MKLKIQHIMDATLLISQIIREQRPMPLRGKFQLARLHAKLVPEFNVIDQQRDALITTYNTKQEKVNAETGETTELDNWVVPPEQMSDFAAKWKEIADQELDIDVAPLALADLDLGSGTNGSVEAHELIILGDFIV